MCNINNMDHEEVDLEKISIGAYPMLFYFIKNQNGGKIIFYE